MITLIYCVIDTRRENAQVPKNTARSSRLTPIASRLMVASGTMSAPVHAVASNDELQMPVRKRLDVHRENLSGVSMSQGD